MPKKRQYKLDFIIKSSPTILYNFLSTPSGLIQWFADHVDLNDKVFSFFWDESEEKADIIDLEENNFIRFRMQEAETEEEYFEFKIDKAEVTGDTILTVTDFSEEIDMEENQRIWKTQIEVLRGRVGGAN